MSSGFFVLFSLLMLLMIAAVVALVAMVISKAVKQHRADADAPRLRAEAQVIDKRTEITGGGDRFTTQRYFVTFQFPDGNRTELLLNGPESGMLTPGDHGTLEWQGSRFVGFARQILR